MLKQVFIIAMAYFGVTVGAGFASGQEMLQYYVSYGFWGLAGAIVVVIVMPLAALIIFQYGSFFRAQSHGPVFQGVTSKITSKFLDYSLMFAQFVIAFVMMAGGGSNLNQQFGFPLWVGSGLMAVMVIVAGMLNVNKVTNILGVLTPFMVVLLLIAGFYALSQPPTSLDAVNQYAIDNVDSPLPNWWLSTLNYIGLCMFSGISMSIIIGGTNWNPRTAGYGGLVGGLIFGGLAVLLTLGLLFQVETVNETDLPTLALINEVHPWLGVFAAIVLYLMIFSTTLGVLYATGKRIVPDGSTTSPWRYRIVLVVLTSVAFGLSYFDFATLVNQVFPILGWLGVVLVVILIGTWASRWRIRIDRESKRRDVVADLIAKKLDPAQEFTWEDYSDLVQLVRTSSISSRELREDITGYVVQALDADEGVDFSAANFDYEEIWADERFRHLGAGEIRVVASARPVTQGEKWIPDEVDGAATLVERPGESLPHDYSKYAATPPGDGAGAETGAKEGEEERP